LFQFAISIRSFWSRTNTIAVKWRKNPVKIDSKSISPDVARSQVGDARVDGRRLRGVDVNMIEDVGLQQVVLHAQSQECVARIRDGNLAICTKKKKETNGLGTYFGCVIGAIL
jgi:hypothetical protein